MLLPLTHSSLVPNATHELILFSVFTEWRKISALLLHSVIIPSQNFLLYLSSSCARVS